MPRRTQVRCPTVGREALSSDACEHTKVKLNTTSTITVLLLLINIIITINIVYYTIITINSTILFLLLM